MKFKSRIGKILGYSLVALITAFAVAITKTIGWRPIIGARHRALTTRKFESTPQRVMRGEYLVQHVTPCILCHSEHNFKEPSAPVIQGMLLAGAHIEEQGMPGDVYSPNLTPDPETGAGRWSDDQLSRAIREGIGHDGRALFPMMPYGHFRFMSDEDVAAVVVYLRTIQPVKHQQPPTKLVFPVNYLIKTVPEPLTQPVPEPDRSTPEKRGAYLVQMSTCSDCHSPSDDHGNPIPGLDFSGGNVFVGPWGSVASVNITPDASGISYYDKELFIQVMRTGMVGARPLSFVMPTSLFHGMTDDDLCDIFAYLKTLKAVHHRIDNNQPPTYCKLCRQKHGAGDQNRIDSLWRFLNESSWAAALRRSPINACPGTAPAGGTASRQGVKLLLNATESESQVVSAEGIESALKQQTKNLTEHSWQS